jgi:hypothetical protein
MSILNIGDRVQFKPPSRLEGRTRTIDNILQDCAGLLYFIELDGPPYRVGDQSLRVVDCHRAGLKKLPTTNAR